MMYFALRRSRCSLSCSRCPYGEAGQRCRRVRRWCSRDPSPTRKSGATKSLVRRSSGSFSSPPLNGSTLVTSTFHRLDRASRAAHTTTL